jgi:hypothetical protein
LKKIKKGGKYMKLEMNNNRKILLILLLVVTVALLATLLTVLGPLGFPLERQGWGRWNLTKERRMEIEQLVEDMRNSGVNWQEIQSTVGAKLREWGINPPPPGDIELFYTVKTVISTVNVVLVIMLLLNYVDIYRKTKSEFTIGLILFSLILLLYTLASTPIMHWLFGFSAFGLGPFVMLPDILACIALSVLLYLSLK